MASTALLVAGGSGVRARSGDGEPPKQFQPLGGRPLIAWSYEVLVAAGCDVVVVAPKEFHDLVRATFGDDVLMADGGESRQVSVRNGLDQVTSEYVVVHDAVRPFPTVEMVEAAVEALADNDGAIVAVSVDETLKRERGGRVLETVDRSDMWRAQTPQAFRTAVLKDAHERALADGVEATDDASLIERYEGSVALVPGSRSNIKVTFPEDFALAEALISARALKR